MNKMKKDKCLVTEARGTCQCEWCKIHRKFQKINKYIFLSAFAMEMNRALQTPEVKRFFCGDRK